MSIYYWLFIIFPTTRIPNSSQRAPDFKSWYLIVSVIFHVYSSNKQISFSVHISIRLNKYICDEKYWFCFGDFADWKKYNCDGYFEICWFWGKPYLLILLFHSVCSARLSLTLSCLFIKQTNNNLSPYHQHQHLFHPHRNSHRDFQITITVGLIFCIEYGYGYFDDTGKFAAVGCSKVYKEIKYIKIACLSFLRRCLWLEGATEICLSNRDCHRPPDSKVIYKGFFKDDANIWIYDTNI